MGVRNILILFFSTMAVSLVILIILFNLIFKNIDMTFETKIPESAPTINFPEDEESKNPVNPFSTTESFSSEFKAKGVRESKVEVPGSSPRNVPASPTTPESDASRANSPMNPPSDPEPLPTLPEPKKSAGSLNEEIRNNPPEVPKVTNSTRQHDVRLKPPIPTSAETSEPEAQKPAPRKVVYQVYIDGFASEAEAHSRVTSLQAKGVEAFVSTSGDQTLVKLGSFNSEESAQRIARENGAKVRKSN